MHRYQTAERADDLYHAVRQPDLLLGLAQRSSAADRGLPDRGDRQECDLPAMGGQAGRSECEYQFRRLAASDRHQHGRLGQAVLRRRRCGQWPRTRRSIVSSMNFLVSSLTGIMA